MKNYKTTDEIVDWLDKKIWENLTYECMPENEHGYYYIPRDKLKKIIDGLIPMIKSNLKNPEQINETK